MGHGGKRVGAGRKSKAEELAFIEKLDNVIDSETAIKKLHQFILDDNFNALKLYLEYRFGKPKETVDNNINFEDNFSLKDLYVKDTKA